jgi:hypothetical protein
MSLLNLFKKKTKLVVGLESNFTHHDTLMVHASFNGRFSVVPQYFLPARYDPTHMCPININRITAYPYCQSIGISYNYIDSDGANLGGVKTAKITKLAYFDRAINKFRVKHTKHYHTYDLPFICHIVKQ